MRLDVAPRSLHVELRERRVRGAGPGHENVVDRRWQIVEESREASEVGRIERGDAGLELVPCAAQAIRVAPRKDHVGSPGAGQPCRLEPDSRAAAITTTVCPASSGLSLNVAVSAPYA